MMKYVFLLLFLSTEVLAVSTSQTISGKVEVTPGCSKKVMVWLSLDKADYKERLLLMHTEVPQGGTYSFFVKSGDYQIRASDEAGCEYLTKVSVKGIDPVIAIKMVKK
jgi:hypothetical protein